MSNAAYVVGGLVLLGIGVWTAVSSSSPIVWIGGFILGLYLLYKGVAE